MHKLGSAVLFALMLIVLAGFQDSRPAAGSVAPPSAWPPFVQKGVRLSAVALSAPPAGQAEAQRLAIIVASQKDRGAARTRGMFTGGSKEAPVFYENDRLLVGAEVLDIQGLWALLSWIDADAPMNMDEKATPKMRQGWINAAQVVDICIWKD